MAETLGVITSAIQLVDTALKAREYVKDFLNAHQDQRQLFSEMDTLKPLLEELQKRVLTHPSRNSFQQMAAPLKQFKTAMKGFTEKLKPTDGRWSRFSEQLSWTLWNKKEAKEYLEEFERIKGLLNNWLVLDIWDMGQHQQHDIIRILKGINDAAEDERQKRLAMKRAELIEWFSPLNSFPRQAEIFSSRQPGTGEWLLEDSRFKAWKSSPGGTIWCHGIPGAGKTVLASFIVHHLRSQFPDGVACIYLNHKETEIQTPSNLLASVWRQLVLNRPISRTIDVLHTEHSEKRTRPTMDEIHSQFSVVVTEHAKVYIIVDALDEYPEDRRGILLESLTKFPTVNLLLTSRPHISIPFPDARVLEIRATEDDIRCFVKRQLQASIRLSKHIAARPEFQHEIEHKLVHSVEGMFLLAKLHMDSLATKNTIRALRDALNNMPKDLEHTYNDAMDRIDRQSEDDRKVARLVLTWVSNAKRPLFIRELQEALAVEPGDTTFDGDNILDADIMLSVCAGLVVIDQTDHIVRLVHYTVQEYLDHIQSSRFPQAQVDITATCLTYLSFDIFENLSRWPNRYTLHKERPFFPYAAEYCLTHGKGQPELPLKDMILMFLECHFSQVYKFHHIDYLWHTKLLEPSATRLSIAAAFNLCEITRHLLVEDEPELNQALHAASKFGAFDTVGVLIDAGATELGAALVTASMYGEEGIVRLLIENGANINLGPPRLESALYVACREGYESIAQILVENGADVNWEAEIPNYSYSSSKRNTDWQLPLFAATARGSEALVGLLTANGAKASINSPSDTLCEAAKNGYEVISQLLLESGAVVDHRAIENVAYAGRLGMVKLFIKHAVNVNMLTALDIASCYGHWDVVHEFITSGCVNLEEQGGRSLLVACCVGEVDIVSLLINNGADVNGRNLELFTNENDNTPLSSWWMDSSNKAPLQIASFKGKETALNLTIDYGNLLQAAVKEGHEKVVRILLDTGADINFTGEIRKSALQIALAKGDEKLIRLLINRGALAETQEYNDALRAALQPGLEELARFLIENGADMNAQSEGVGTVLEAASAKGAESMVQLLIENGADVNEQGGYYGTALQAAAMEGHESIVRILLDNGANIHAQGGPYGSALEAAAREGHQNIVCLLETAAGVEWLDIDELIGFRLRDLI
ncbi:ankyrin repeat-containing domain protein [Mycena latifolia]|nr:ankyrin repeat-containing domain protein [Mycena latifolia]